MKVVTSDKAEADLEAIADLIAEDSPLRAITFVQELRAACLGLERNPARSQHISRRPHAGIRRRVHGPYLIFYRVEDSQVTILRVLHGARDYEAVLFPEERTS